MTTKVTKARCYVCLGEDEPPPYSFVTPCLCTGTTRIHYHCLQGLPWKHCTVCSYTYKLGCNLGWWDWIKTFVRIAYKYSYTNTRDYKLKAGVMITSSFYFIRQSIVLYNDPFVHMRFEATVTYATGLLSLLVVSEIIKWSWKEMRSKHYFILYK